MSQFLITSLNDYQTNAVSKIRKKKDFIHVSKPQNLVSRKEVVPFFFDIISADMLLVYSHTDSRQNNILLHNSTHAEKKAEGDIGGHATAHYARGGCTFDSEDHMVHPYHMSASGHTKSLAVSCFLLIFAELGKSELTAAYVRDDCF